MKHSKLLPAVIAVVVVVAVIAAVCLLHESAQPSVDEPPVIDPPAAGTPTADPAQPQGDQPPAGSTEAPNAPDAGETSDGSAGASTVLEGLPSELVTPDTLPDDPQEYYLVAALPEEHTWLYARNYGQDSMILWDGNIYRPFDGRVAHTGHMVLPTLYLLEDTSEGSTVAAVSEVGTGTGMDIYELVVYVMLGANPTGIQDYVYDWHVITDDFSQNNTLTYDAQTNSLTLVWNGDTYQTGTLRSDLGQALDLEDGWTGTLVASGDIIRFAHNDDGSFTVTAEASVCGYPLSIGVTGLTLTWTVRFNGAGFAESGTAVEVVQS